MVADEILINENVTKRVFKNIKRSKRIQNKTYGVNLVNDDNQEIDRRMISTCTIEHDPNNFDEVMISIKLKK